MLPIKFLKVIYFSSIPDDLVKFSCLSGSLDVKVKSDRNYLFKLYVYEPDYENYTDDLNPSGELCSEDPHIGAVSANSEDE